MPNLVLIGRIKGFSQATPENDPLLLKACIAYTMGRDDGGAK
jgi:hypothetical protein